MAKGISLIVFPVKDLEKATKFYSVFLGAEPYVAGDYYVGYKTSGPEVGLDPNSTAVVSYIDVDDLEAALDELQAAGATPVMPPKEVGGGIRVAQVEIDGNVMGLRQGAK